MVELNQRERTIKIKIVYYGPPVGGKTTNLKLLHQGAFWSRRGELVSVNSAQDRTILFDFMPLKTSGFRGFDVKLQLIAVPGQAMYSASRRVALKATDGVVFVANSANDRWEENQQSYKEMVQYLSGYQIDPATIPLILQYNKRDLPSVMPIESLDNGLNQRKVQSIPAIAAKGEGVLETFSAILLATIQDLSTRFRTIEMAKGQTPKTWVEETVKGIFGKQSLAVSATAAVEHNVVPDGYEMLVATPPPAEHRKLQIAMDDLPRQPTTAAQQAKLQESLAESYAEASAELSIVNSEVREERDAARRQLEQVRRLIQVGDDLAWGQSLAPLSKVLDVFAEAGATAYVSILLPAAGTAFRALTRPPLTQDPLLTRPGGLTLIEQYRGDEAPSLARGEDVYELAQVLYDFEPPLGALAIAPLRTPTRLLGFVACYYSHDAALPSQSALDHLGLLAKVIRSPLELAFDKGKGKA